jgi:hypothetical protein
MIESILDSIGQESTTLLLFCQEMTVMYSCERLFSKLSSDVSFSKPYLF